MTAIGEIPLVQRKEQVDKRFSGRKAIALTAVTLVLAGGVLSGCKTGEVLHGGYVVDKQSLDLIPVGSSREQVLLTMGTPSTTATFDNEVFYYISQKRERAMAFMKPKLVEQNVIAIYFDKDGVVSRRADYSLQDGKVFDSISRTTPTGGKDLTFLQQMLSGGASGRNAIRNMFGGGTDM